MRKLLLVGAILLLSGCATLSNVKDARGSGHSRIYNVTYQKVWEAVPRAISILGPSIVSIDEKAGRILAETPVFQFASYGEVIAVFVEKMDETHTKVEVVSRKRMATNIFAYSYQDRILDGLDRELGVQTVGQATSR